MKTFTLNMDPLLARVSQYAAAGMNQGNMKYIADAMYALLPNTRRDKIQQLLLDAATTYLTCWFPNDKEQNFLAAFPMHTKADEILETIFSVLGEKLGNHYDEKDRVEIIHRFKTDGKQFDIFETTDGISIAIHEKPCLYAIHDRFMSNMKEF